MVRTLRGLVRLSLIPGRGWGWTASSTHTGLRMGEGRAPRNRMDSDTRGDVGVPWESVVPPEFLWETSGVFGGRRVWRPRPEAASV